MKKSNIIFLSMLFPIASFAQSAIDAMDISQSQLSGSARFMSMGGAFTALGGDISSIKQNPAGIGIYRSNEVGLTLNLNFQNTKTSPSVSNFPSTYSQTKFNFNNFGYVGSTQLNGAMRTFNWGVSFNRLTSFDRVYQGYVPSTTTSLSNYIAAFTSESGALPQDLAHGDNYNPYFQSNEDWLSILAYNSYIINDQGTSYTGLFKHNTVGDALPLVRESGYLDEYNISFGGNVENVVYWGLGFGITDLNYQKIIQYSESMNNANVPVIDANGSVTRLSNGTANFELYSPKSITGSGWNVKFGVIIKPVNELRIGLAVHTPTWTSLTQAYYGEINSDFTPNNAVEKVKQNDYTEDANFNWKYNAPWKFMIGVAGVISNKAIISLDYQYDAYNDMRISTPNYRDNYILGYESNSYLNQDVKDYFKAANTIRVGLEYRLTPQVSLRAGFNSKTSNVKPNAANGNVTIFTSGTDTSFDFDNHTNYFSLGLGYRYQSWYIDAAYVYKDRESTFHAYTNFNGFEAPKLKVNDNNSQVVISTGFKF